MGTEKKNRFKTQQVIEMEGWEDINFKGATVLLLWYVYQIDQLANRNIV